MPHPSPQLSSTSKTTSRDDWPLYEAIPEPRMVAIYEGNASGSKLYQSFLDGHPQIFMIPAYPLLYFYPHWQQWEHEFKGNWTWQTIIDRFCIQHASVIDSGGIDGHNGMTKLGDSLDQSVNIDEGLFRSFLGHLLQGQEISSRTFLLAVHYAYAFCHGENLLEKPVLVYHIHFTEYLADFLAPDFPDLLTIGFVRDPRSSIHGRYINSHETVDDLKLDRTDALIYRRRTYVFVSYNLIEGLEFVRGLNPDTVRVIRHEDMHLRLEDVMRASAQFIGIDFHPGLLECTFGGLSWWGDKIYNMKPMNRANPKVVSKEWQSKLPAVDWFILEGLFFDYCRRYGIELYKYKHDSSINRALLFLALLLPSHFEWRFIREYLSPATIADFLNASINEGSGRTPLKDYSFHAYYRHKFTTRDLGLWKGRWFKKMVGWSSRSPLWRWPGVCLYTLVNIIRYIWSILIIPVMLIKRYRYSFAGYRRHIAKTGTMPDIL